MKVMGENESKASFISASCHQYPRNISVLDVMIMRKITVRIQPVSSHFTELSRQYYCINQSIQGLTSFLLEISSFHSNCLMEAGM
jgi:hypothetical protein